MPDYKCNQGRYRATIPCMTTTRPADNQPENPTDTMADALDSTAAAQILGMTEDGVRKRIAKGKLEGYKDQGRWYVYLPDNNQARRSRVDTPQENQTDTRQTPDRRK